MPPGSPDPFEHKLWRIDQRRAGAWRCWDGEVVIYDDISGDTLKLDVIMAEAFWFLLRAPATQQQLTDHLASAFDLETDAQVQNLAAMALRKFNQAGVIEPLPAGA